MALRDGLRSGDVHVPGSRRYADPASFLLTPQQWEPQRLEFCHVTGKPASAAEALALANDELHAALADLEAQLARGGGPGEVRLGADGELVIPPLTAEDVPAEAEALRDELGAMLPRVPIASVLVDVDARTGFTDHLVHAGGKVARPPELKRNLLYVIIAEATNMGLGAMAESCGVPYDVLAWTAEWYFRGETLEAANAAIVNYHHRLPMTRAFGTGTLSSSDGQRFPVKGKSLTARHLSRYFARGQGLSTYTHVSDQHSTFDTKVIAATDPESPYVLDGILGNQTDLLITEHATDTHGATLANFALFDLVGLQLSPRIRDLGKITLYRTGPRADFAARYPSAGHLLTRRLNEDLITGMWDDLLRVAASVKGGHATAALVVGKLCSSKRPAERPRGRDQGVRGAAPHRLRRPLPGRRDLPAADRPPAEQGREPARAQAVARLRRRRGAPSPAPRAAGRADVVPDPGHQRGRHLDHGIPRPGRHRPAARRAGHRRRGPGAHLAHPPRERPLLRHPLRRRRRRARQARLRRLPAATRRRRHGAGPVSAGKPEIRLHRLRAHPGRVASFVIGDRSRRLVTYGDGSAVARHAISAWALRAENTAKKGDLHNRLSVVGAALALWGAGPVRRWPIRSRDASGLR